MNTIIYFPYSEGFISFIFKRLSAFWYYKYPDSFCKFPVLDLESTIPQGSLNSFLWEMLFRNIIWVVGVFIPIGLSQCF